MNKTELVSALADRTELNKKESGEFVDVVLGQITSALSEGEKVQIFGFGNFEVRKRSARKGRNPQTGEEIDIVASKSVGFKPAKALKEAVK